MNNSVISDIEGTNNAFKDASKSLVDFADASKKWNDNSTLSKLGDLLGASKNLSKLAASLGVVGAGLGLVSIFAGGKSDTAMILEAIDGISKQIDSLQELMSNKFDHLEDVVKFNTAKTQLFTHINYLITVKSLVLLYNEAETDDEKKEAEGRLLELKRSEILEAAQGLANCAMGVGGANNIFDTSIDATYAEINTICYTGSTMVSLCSIAVIADSLISSLDISNKNILSDEEVFRRIDASSKNADRLFSPLGDNIFEAWDEACTECEKNVSTYINKFMENEVLPKLPSKNKQSSANTARRELDNNYCWLDFFVVTYKDITGYSKHGWKGHKGNSWFRKRVKDGNINIVIKWTNNEEKVKEPLNSKVDYEYFEGPMIKNGQVSVKDLSDKELKAYEKLSKSMMQPMMYVKKSHFKGNAEDFAWKDVRNMFDNLLIRSTSPRLFWACKNKNDIAADWSNDKRVHWKVGSKFTVAILN